MNYIYNQFIADYNKISDRIYLGNIAGAQNPELYKKHNVKYVINLANQTYPKYNEAIYLDIPIQDVPQTNIKQYFIPAINFINSALKNNGNIYIHCRAGVSRSATILLAYLIHSGLSMKDALNYVNSKRDIINPNKGFWQQLMEFEKQIHKNNTVKDKKHYDI